MFSSTFWIPTPGVMFTAKDYIIITCSCSCHVYHLYRALNSIKCHQVPSSAFLCWRSLTMIQTLLSTPLHLAKHLEMTASLPKSWSAEKETSSLSGMKSFVSAAEKVKCHKTWGMQTSSHCTRTKAIGVTAITTVASPSKFQVYILCI